MEKINSLIRILVEAYISSLPPREKIENPALKRVTVSQTPAPRIAGHVVPPIDRGSFSLRKVMKKYLEDIDESDLRFVLDKYDVDSTNYLEKLSSNSSLRKELGLGDVSKKNSELYKKIYKLASQSR
jgi:hypothetical protein